MTGRRPTVAVIGAGIAGLGLGMRLRSRGHDAFTIFERAHDVGGVWRDNVYPGVACDIPSNLYSYSFLPPHNWTRAFGTGAEIQQYLSAAADHAGLGPHLRLGTAMERATWDETTNRWQVSAAGRTHEADVLVLAAGRLTAARAPTAVGLDSFAGRAFHSSAWDQLSLEGLRVGVVGTGASAVQLLPHVARSAAHTVVFQRTPTWVLPRGDRAFGPGEVRPDRGALAAEAERLFEARLAGSSAAAALRARALAHLRTQTADPEMRAVLTPAYEIGCKRAVFSDEYYPALQRPDVTLEPSALGEVGPTWARAASGATYDLDVLVFATGFDTACQPYGALVAGRKGETLADHWSTGMTSHASIAVNGFPNLFVLDGPNATLGHHSAFEVIEGQIDYVLGALDHLATATEPLEVTQAAEAAYTSLIDGLAARTVWMQGGCDSWYLHPVSGRLSLLWPGRADEFRKRNGHFDPTPFIGSQADGY